MSNDNLALWSSVERTDPKHVKPITGKTYGGNSPKPHYLVHKATEAFGPCGIGWGFNIVSERVEDGPQGERMHIAHVKVWYEYQGKRGEVEHIGGTPFSGVRASGKPFMDEDAPKKSVTDALVKALSMIGFAGDIFMGRFDDSKYVEELRHEERERNATPTRGGPPNPPQSVKNVVRPLSVHESETVMETLRTALICCTTFKDIDEWYDQNETTIRRISQTDYDALMVDRAKHIETLKQKKVA